MIDVSRRHLLTGTAAISAAAAFGLPPSGAQAATAAGSTGIYRTKLGDYELTQLSDGARSFAVPDGFVINVPKDQVLAATAAAYMPDGQMTIPFAPLAVNTGSKLVLIDTGNGLGAFEQSKGAVGRARGNMEAAGIDPAKVDIVLISHFHGDHIGGLKNADGSMAFPNAEIKVPAVEYAFWMDEANASKANGFNKQQFPNVKKMMDGVKVTQFEAGKEVAPGITSVFTPGHTPGHTSFVVASGASKIIVQADVTNVASIFLKNPNFHAVFDNDPALAETTRRKFYDMASAEKSLITGYHWPFPCAGHVEKDGNGYRMVPVTA